MIKPILLHYQDYCISPENSITVERRNHQDYFPLHYHDFEELVVVSSGNGLHIWNEHIHPITCGDILYINRKDIHSYESVNDLKLDNILYQPEKFSIADIISQYLPYEKTPQEQRFWRIDLFYLKRIFMIVDQLALESKKNNISSIHLSEALFLELIILLFRFRYKADNSTPADIQQIDMIFSALYGSIETTFNFELFCQKNRFSPRAIQRLFKQQTNMTIGQYLQKLRICRAMTLLRTSSLSIADIALKCGYEDSNYFSLVFRKMQNCPPSEYRKNFMIK
ncbi:hypothetical protein A1D23_06300 [Chelonobacter oris]|uniref:helix-turn-helix domain-containing protein n=1 Tax=Chelonobacter oris TaxID=505317 RepID=UPI0024472DD4|nr:helix-turn-helix domain-containing protein [Chelonobacter oris]MDH2999703.1 hypothetical protein [Chelonobacter oris]